MGSEKNRRRTLKQVFYILSVLLLTSCTWVKDDNEDCPYGFWLNLHYTYNMLDVEAAPEYIEEVSVYVYDTNGNYVTRIDAPTQTLKANNYRVKVEGLEDGDYQFVVWSGVANGRYAVSGDKTILTDFRLSLSGSSLICSDQLPDLYYGSLSNVHYDDAHAVHDVYLMKNTNELACCIVTTDANVTIDADDYSMKIVSANGTMDAANRLVADKKISYEPFKQEAVYIKDADYGDLHGFKCNISTLRLMQKTDCRMILVKKETGQEIFNISLPDLLGELGTLYTKLGKPLTVQEYLDRQDFYTLIFIYSGDLDQLIQFQVNSWKLRANNHIKV